MGMVAAGPAFPNHGRCAWTSSPSSDIGGTSILTAAADKAGYRILAVDDDPLVLRALEAVLRVWGYEVLAANGIDEAQRLLQACGKPDAVVTDYLLQDEDTGVMVLDEIRRIYGPGTPALVITGNAQPGTLRRMVGSEVPILEKPVNPKLLKAVVEQICNGDPRAAHMR